jgi:hypothetical protein
LHLTIDDDDDVGLGRIDVAPVAFVEATVWLRGAVDGCWRGMNDSSPPPRLDDVVLEMATEAFQAAVHAGDRQHATTGRPADHRDASAAIVTQSATPSAQLARASVPTSDETASTGAVICGAVQRASMRLAARRRGRRLRVSGGAVDVGSGICDLGVQSVYIAAKAVDDRSSTWHDGTSTRWP